MAKYSDAGVVDQNIERAELGVDEPEQLGNLFMALNIGSFALDFTGSLRRQLRDRAIDGFLPLTTIATAAPSSNNIFAMARPIPRVPPVTRQTCSLSGFMESSIDRVEGTRRVSGERGTPLGEKL